MREILTNLTEKEIAYGLRMYGLFLEGKKMTAALMHDALLQVGDGEYVRLGEASWSDWQAQKQVRLAQIAEAKAELKYTERLMLNFTGSKKH